MREVMRGDAEPAALAGFLIALRGKGETANEISGLIEAILSEAVAVPVDQDAVDIVGTGGDQAHIVNISTMAALVACGAGIPVVKHGGRAVSSKSGSADVLAALGIPLDLTPDAVARCVQEAGIGYLFAPRFHAGLHHAAPIRRILGVPTVINFVAPLVNPAQPRAGCIGCANLPLAPVLAQVLADRRSSALVVRGHDELDEISTATPTQVWVASGKTVRETVLDAADFGLPRSKAGDLAGGDATYNAKVAHRVLVGDRGPVRDAVLVNAAAGIAAYCGLDGDLTAAIGAGLAEATRSIDSGAARSALDRWVTVAQAASTTG
ncbi:anthranilate phosphoribosyltransferase [Micromonospora peucetia]|uniref:Bifunctional protein TrpGD n=1 Tax=Micromonospora peucetia TaxID=47871 RepID=A0A1C6W505_9ACTN|nr:anthranilate phosphoribosyltransferase [Micromonospora peucetia]